MMMGEEFRSRLGTAEDHYCDHCGDPGAEVYAVGYLRLNAPFGTREIYLCDPCARKSGRIR